MFCDRCGTELPDSANFCTKCGRSFGPAAPLMPVKSRIAGHIRLLGILWIALSAFRLLPGVVLWIITSPEVRIFPPDVPEFLVPMLRSFAVLFFIAGLAGLAAGWGLLARQPWGRMLAIVLGALSLLDMPFGTALGIYSFWVLLPAQSEEEYRQMSSTT